MLLHGGGQNAHTWDTVALALGQPLVAIDLPGHGHSDGPRDGAAGFGANAEDVATTIRALAPNAAGVVGMSAGGLTALALTSIAADLVRKLVLVDILPSPDPAMTKRITDFVAGPETFADFDEILARTVQFNPTRSESSLRRGILHNAVQLDDGSWQWRHRRHRPDPAPESTSAPADSAPARPDPSQRIAALWDTISAIEVPTMLVRGMATGSVVTDDQEAELARRLPLGPHRTRRGRRPQHPGRQAGGARRAHRRLRELSARTFNPGRDESAASCP